MNEARERALKRSQALAYLLDESIRVPGTSFRIGWDFIIGLLPGIGDLLTSLSSTYIVAQAMEFGVARSTILRMVWNILIETVVGTIPLLGDLFDAAWKSNLKNARLLEAALRDENQVEKKDLVFMLLVLGGLVFLAVAAGAFGLTILKLLRDWIVSIT